MRSYIKKTLRCRFDKHKTPIRVYVFKDYDAYHKFGDSKGVDLRGSSGSCHSWYVEDYRNGKSGDERFEIEVLLINQHLGAGYVAHEMIHAGFALAKEHGIIETSREETIALHAGELDAEFWGWFLPLMEQGNK